MTNCEATFRLFATPELEELAYIKARAVNNGNLTFIASQRVSVFLAGTFITKTPLKLTSPGESFIVFLGVEAAVKVQHRTIKNVLTAGGKKRGLLRSATKSSRLVDQRTLLTSNLPHSMEITVVHLLPRASSDKIVVSLLQPPRKNVPISGEKSTSDSTTATANNGNPNTAGEGALGENSVMQNKLTNNVVFNRTMTPGQKQEIAFEYLVEWPHDANTGQVEIV